MKTVLLTMMLLAATSARVQDPNVDPKVHPNGDPNGVVTGRLLSATGAPIAGVRVAAMAVPDSNALAAGAEILASIAQTDESGRYRLENISPGPYYITAGDLDAPMYFPGISARSAARVLAVTAGTTLEGVDFRITIQRVSGRLAASSNGQPPEAKVIMLVPLAGRPLQATVHADGTFEFPRVAAGAYAARALDLPESTIVVTDHDLIGVTLGAGNFISIGETALAPAPPPVRNGIVTGRVLSRDGTPEKWIPVTAIVSGSTNTVSVGQTDGAGRYRLYDIPAGSYVITSGLPDRPTYYPGVTDPPAARSVAVSGGLTTADVDFTLQSPYAVTVSGRVTADLNAARNPLKVALSPAPEGKLLESVVRPDGTFDIPGVPPGLYSVRTVPDLGVPAFAITVEERDFTGMDIGRQRVTQP